MIVRYAKIAMNLALAAFFLLVTFDNITDYGSNYQFVQHVLSMDTTFPGNALMYRAITEPLLWHLAYGIVIALQGVTGVLYLLGAVRLYQALRAPGAGFEQAKTYTIAAGTLGFVIFFFLFMVIGGEWFSMWQSKDWNAQTAAFRFYIAVLGVLIFVALPDADLPGNTAKHGTRKRQDADKVER
ncbi:MAG: DUF2165 domain-containing protein [Alphaproteobacteria bacterium]|nr:DUF2165 domain-containing protein [Alphaproteobacteria bacterium]